MLQPSNPHVWGTDSLAGQVRAKRIRRRVVELIHATGEGHYGGSLSMVDILCVLFSRFVDRERGDRFILSKGHGAPGYYATLVEFGILAERTLEGYGGFGAALQGHPDMTLNTAIDFSTGSLGQGLSAALGMAIALAQTPARSWVLLGDGECQEGQVWEACMLAARLERGNLIAIVDANGHQEYGFRRRGEAVQPVLNLAEKWRAFGWQVAEVDGHDHLQLTEALNDFSRFRLSPGVVIANTVKGRGSALLEADPDRFHCGRLTACEFREVMEELQ